MKKSPLQLESPRYPVVEVRSYPGVTEAMLDKDLPITVKGAVNYELDGDHVVFLTVSQDNKEYPCTFEVQAFAIFRIDVDTAKECYKKAFNPAVVACNVASVLYSGARELIALVSSRGPYGQAMLPSVVIEPSDLDLSFEGGRHEEILGKYFDFDEKRLAELKRAISQSGGKQGKKTISNKNKKENV